MLQTSNGDNLKHPISSVTLDWGVIYKSAAALQWTFWLLWKCLIMKTNSIQCTGTLANKRSTSHTLESEATSCRNRSLWKLCYKLGAAFSEHIQFWMVFFQTSRVQRENRNKPPNPPPWVEMLYGKLKDDQRKNIFVKSRMVCYHVGYRPWAQSSLAKNYRISRSKKVRKGNINWWDLYGPFHTI